MTRPDKLHERRQRALDALRRARCRTQEKIADIEAALAAFERNEKSLDKPTACVERELQELRRALDQQNIEIMALTHPSKMTVSLARLIEEHPKTW